MLNFFISDNKKLDWLNNNDQTLDAPEKKDATNTTNSLFDSKENTPTTSNLDNTENVFSTKNQTKDSTPNSLFSGKTNKITNQTASNPFNLSLQTKSTVENKTQAETQKTADTQKENNQTPEKFQQLMDKTTKGEYSKANTDQKKELIAKFVKTNKVTESVNDDQQDRAMKNVHSLLSGTNKKEERTLIIEAIQKVDVKDQLALTEVALKSGDDKQKALAETTVAHGVSNYHRSVQLDVAKLIIDTKNKNAVLALSQQVSKLDATRENNTSNQVEAVKLLQNSELEPKDQKAIDKTIIDQYAQIDKASQLDVHETMSASELSDSVEYAASNIWHMDKSNQAAAVDITIATDNEDAINNASEQYGKYDDSAKADIKESIEATDYTEAKSYIEHYSESDTDNDIDNETRNTQNDDDYDDDETSSNTSNIDNDDDYYTNYNDCDINEIQKEISETAGNKQQILDIVNDLSDAQKIELLQQNPTSDVITAILNSHPTLAVLEKIDPQTLKTLGYKNIGSLICFLNIDGQKALVEQAAENGNLSGINRDYLLAPIKNEYDKLKKELQNKEGQQTHNNNKLEVKA